jgi:hypothetical protein
MDEEDSPPIWKLRLIAEILKVPVERFFVDDTPPDGVLGTDECLRLWSLIRTSDGRDRALKCLREVLADEQR